MNNKIYGPKDLRRRWSSSGKKLSTFEFCFPGKTENFYWSRTKELAEKPVQLASTFSLFFSAAPKTRKKLNVLDTLPERDISQALFF